MSEEIREKSPLQKEIEEAAEAKKAEVQALVALVVAEVRKTLAAEAGTKKSAK